MTPDDHVPLPASCGPDSGRVIPVVDRNRCEGKADCVTVCPYDVFEIQSVSREVRSDLSLLGRVKLAVHGGKQAFASGADDCHACGVCVEACPENAISLAPRRSN